MIAVPALVVLLALAPGLLVTTLLFGPGTLLNLLAGSLVLLVVNRMRKQRLPGSRLPWVGVVVLALALPPATPLWLVVPCAVLVGLLHARDATRRLPFNTALLAAALLFLAFPGRLPAWPSVPAGVDGWTAQVRQAMTGEPVTDASTGATALVAMAQRSPFTISEIRAASAAFGRWGGAGSEWVAIAWLAGGLWLLQRRVVAWHAPLGCIVGAACAAAALYEGDGALGGAPPTLHLLAGSTLLVAFFALTEPGSRPRLPSGQLLSGLFAGTLIVTLRHRAGGADHAAVVVLLANALAPVFDALGSRLRRPQRPAAGTAGESP